MDMKKRIGVALILMLPFFLFISSLNFHRTGVIEKHAPAHAFTGYLDNRIPALMNYYEIPGVAIALVQRGKIIWTRAYGYADQENRKKMTADTYCRVESISKPVTAWGIMRLVSQGKIDLDKPVVYYLKRWKFPESAFPSKNITVRMLLSHTAGMPLGTIGVRYSPEGAIPSLMDSLSKNAIPERRPGVSFSYSNTGFHLLELLIEEVTGRDFARYMKEEILIPLGMRHSDFNWRKDFTPPVPPGHDLNGNPIPVYVYPEKASGGLFSTVGDIAAFIAAGMHGFSRAGTDVLSTRDIDNLYTPTTEIPGYYGLVFNSYGLGHFIENLSDGKTALSHGGQGTGWMTHFHSVPETGDGIVILTNSQRSWPFIALVLRDWAKWSGFPPLGMELIIQGEKALWVFIALLMSVLMWQAWRIGRKIISGERRFTSITKGLTPLRLVQTALSAILAAIIIWSLNQDYLFIFSVFPIASNWLGFSLIISSVVLLLSALFPCEKVRK